MLSLSNSVYNRKYQTGTLLIDLTTGSTMAFSLRKLRSAYGGYAVRIRRSTDNAETNIGFTITGDFDSAAFSAFIGAGSGFVTTWYDQSLNGYHLTQPTAANQPQLVLSGANLFNKPALYSDGNKWLYNSAANITTGLIQTYTIAYTTTPQTLGSLWGNRTSPINSILGLGSATEDYIQIYGDSSGLRYSRSIINTKSWIQTTIGLGVGGLAVSTNNFASVNATNPSFTARNGFTIFSNGSAPSNKASGYIAEIIEYNASGSAAIVKPNQMTYYGI